MYCDSLKLMMLSGCGHSPADPYTLRPNTVDGCLVAIVAKCQCTPPAQMKAAELVVVHTNLVND